MLYHLDGKSYLEALHKLFVIVIIDKAANKFDFISNKYYISKLLAEKLVFLTQNLNHI